MYKLLVALTLVVAVVAVVPTRTTLFDRNVTPKNWVRGGFAPKTEVTRFRIALKQRNVHVLEKLLHAVSNPDSPKYQKYVTPKQINEIVAPEASIVTEVMNWVKSAGRSRIVNNGDALEVITTIRVAEKLFNTQFYSFRHTESGKRIARQYGPMSAPVHVSKHVEFVTGISSFPVPHYKVQVATPEDMANAIVPQTVNILYNVPAQTINGHPATSVGVIEFEQQNYAPSDLVAFAQGVAININPVSKTVGTNDPTNPQIEAALDIEYVCTVNPSAQSWFWIEDPQYWVYDFANHFANAASRPQVVSISYGWAEANQCDIDPTECQNLGVDSYGYVARTNTEFMKVGTLGSTLIVASGDSGANGRTDPDCTLPFLKPAYPAASPYVLAVGATQLNNPTGPFPGTLPPFCDPSQGNGYVCANAGTEVAVSYAVAGFASGGGFSDVAMMPSWQNNAVNKYLGSGVQLPPSTYFNSTGRGFPDVAAFGTAILIYQGGLEPVGGTSASAPIWAGVVSVLNQAALAGRNGAPLGLVAPLLYKAWADSSCAGCFTDITVGDNTCTEDGCSPSCQGYYCAKGWDPVTGLGSPNVGKLFTYISAMLKK